MRPLDAAAGQVLERDQKGDQPVSPIWIYQYRGLIPARLVAMVDKAFQNPVKTC